MTLRSDALCSKMPNKPHAKQQDVIEAVVQNFAHAPERFVRDLPAIRTALNDTMDSFERDGVLSRSQSDRWSQDRMVRAVQKRLCRCVKIGRAHV